LNPISTGNFIPPFRGTFAQTVIRLGCWVALFNAGSFARAQVDELLDLAAEAKAANEAALITASGAGKVSYLVHEADQPVPTAVLDSDIEFFFEDSKFHVHLAHTQKLIEAMRKEGQDDDDYQRWVPSGISEQYVIYDGKKVTAVDVMSDGTFKGKIYFGFAKLGVMRSAGFPFENPVDLYSQALDVKSSDTRKSVITPLSNGGFLGLLTKNTYRMKFFFLGQHGYDLRRVSSFRNGETQPFRDFLISWASENGVHFVQRFTNTVTTAHGNTGSSRQTTKRLTVQYDDYQVNEPIDPKIFTLDAVPVPNGSIFLDKRANVEGGPAKMVMIDSVLQRMD